MIKKEYPESELTGKIIALNKLSNHSLVVEYLKTEMKRTIPFLLLTFILWSCTSDNFYETEGYFTTDKNFYQVGDELRLTVFIVPEKDEKEIRLYDNYKNLRISFAVVNNKKGIYNGSWTKSSDDFLDDTSTTTHKITKEKPFEKTFIGKITESETEIIIEILELNFKVGLPKSDFDENTTVRIHGHCDPIDPEIGASIEEFIEVKDIRIVTK